MKNKYKLIEGKIKTLNQIDNTIYKLENERGLTVCMENEDFCSLWGYNISAEFRNFINPLEDKIKEICLLDLKKKRDEIELLLNDSIKLKVTNDK
tara:strand:+ start:239 stop:523 length:285 start_codon:yes stop_codon:yes gene_type:complete